MLQLVQALALCWTGLYYYLQKDACITPKECADVGMRVYEVNRLCIWPVPAEDGGFELNDEGAYACRTGWYAVFSGMTARCVASAAECEDLYVVEAMKACVKDSSNCNLLSASPYDRTDTKECVT